MRSTILILSVWVAFTFTWKPNNEIYLASLSTQEPVKCIKPIFSFRQTFLQFKMKYQDNMTMSQSTHCSSCEKSFETLLAKKVHEQHMHIFVFKCENCETKFASERNLSKHMVKCNEKQPQVVKGKFCLMLLSLFYYYVLRWFR